MSHGSALAYYQGKKIEAEVALQYEPRENFRLALKQVIFAYDKEIAAIRKGEAPDVSEGTFDRPAPPQAGVIGK